MWVLDHLADLESDLSRFHRVDDIEQLDGPKFFRLAWRVSTYGGVMNLHVQQQLAKQQEPTPAVAPTRSQRPAAPARTGSKPLAAFSVAFPDVIEKRKA